MVIDLNMRWNQPVSVLCDSASAEQLAGDQGCKTRSRHIIICYGNVREAVKNGFMVLKHCASDENVADMFTKCLQVDKFVKFREALKLTLAA